MREEKECKGCGKRYIFEFCNLPSKMEEQRYRDSYYTCPYCNHTTNVRLSSKEDIRTLKLDSQ